MLKRFLRPHAILLSIAIILFIWLMGKIRLNMHYLDPFNNGLKDYEITDIVYAYLGRPTEFTEDRIVIINSGRPDRARLAALVDKLHLAGAKTIGLDFYFSQTSGLTADTLLQQSIQRADNVVLACTLKDEDLTDDRLEGISGVDTFFSNYAPIGFGNFPSNSSKTVRVFSPWEMVNDQIVPAFSTAIMGIYDPEVQSDFLKRGRALEHIFYTGHKPDFISNNLDQVLDSMTVEELRLTCQDRIVLVGYAPDDQWANPLLDRHYTPTNQHYDTKSIPDMYGIVIHANVLSMMLNQTYIYNVPKWLTYLISILICYANVLFFQLIFRRFHQSFHGITRAIQLLEFVFFFFLVSFLFYYFRIKLDLKVGILATLLAYDFIMIYESLILPRVAFLRSLPDTFTFTKTVPPPEPVNEDIASFSPPPPSTPPIPPLSISPNGAPLILPTLLPFEEEEE